MSYLSVGKVIPWTADPNPTSGDHLDVKINRLYGDRGHVNPLLKPELLERIRIGDNYSGLSSFPITSGYGPRDTGIKGASKYHKGIDYGIPSGTQIYWQGEGRYSPENTIGVIYTNDSAGNPYEILLTHTQLQGATGGAAPAYVPMSDTTTVTIPATPDVSTDVRYSLTPETPAQTAVERALNYKEMTKQELDTEYDRLRNESPDTAAAEGMKMHMAYFNK